MIPPLGPRGQRGSHRSATGTLLEALTLLVEYAAKGIGVRLHTRSDGTTAITDLRRKMRGRKRENAARRARRSSAPKGWEQV